MRVARESKGSPTVFADPSFGEPVAQQVAGAGAVQRPAARGGRRRRSVTTARDLSEIYFAPLNGTAQEARTIHALYPEANLLTGERATESALKAVAAPRVLHIATHGFFLQDGRNEAAGNEQLAARGASASASARIGNPLLRSGLALADANLRGIGGAGDDGILTALEASGLNLWGTKLVVLSACDTGLGEVRNGEGVYGLRRAFVLAGAESLVMSLWPASDNATRKLMASYYRNLKQGMGRGESLRLVQLDMLKSNPRLHPFYWANFIQSGEWANLDGKR
jgi:CHAT domain-containing protein